MKPVLCCLREIALSQVVSRILRVPESEKGSGTVVRSTLRAVPATVPDPFSDMTPFRILIARSGTASATACRRACPFAVCAITAF